MTESQSSANPRRDSRSLFSGEYPISSACMQASPLCELPAQNSRRFAQTSGQDASGDTRGIAGYQTSRCTLSLASWFRFRNPREIPRVNMSLANLPPRATPTSFPRRQLAERHARRLAYCACCERKNARKGALQRATRSECQMGATRTRESPSADG